MTLPRPEKTAANWNVIFPVEFFSLAIRCNDSALEEIEFLPTRQTQAADSALAAFAMQQIKTWLDDVTFTFNLPLRLSGTEFQRRVWAAISAIPPGNTRTYGEIAAELASAPRAIGQACGANDFPVVIPCHRVVARNSMLGGFAHNREGWLLDIKRWLLAHEKQLTR